METKVRSQRGLRKQNKLSEHTEPDIVPSLSSLLRDLMRKDVEWVDSKEFKKKKKMAFQALRDLEKEASFGDAIVINEAIPRIHTYS